MNIALPRTTEVEAVIVSDDSEDASSEVDDDVEIAEQLEPAAKRRRFNPTKQFNCYHSIGPLAWRKIIANLIDVHNEAVGQPDMVPWGATTPLMVMLLMARRDALDLAKAWPALIQDHAH